MRNRKKRKNPRIKSNKKAKDGKIKTFKDANTAREKKGSGEKERDVTPSGIGLDTGQG